MYYGNASRAAGASTAAGSAEEALIAKRNKQRMQRASHAYGEAPPDCHARSRNQAVTPLAHEGQGQWELLLATGNSRHQGSGSLAMEMNEVLEGRRRKLASVEPAKSDGGASSVATGPVATVRNELGKIVMLLHPCFVPFYVQS